MNTTDFGPELTTNEDRTYRGSRFAEVRDAIFANPYYGKVWPGPGDESIPRAEVTNRSVFAGILPFGKPFFFGQAARRTVDAHGDLRWGADRKGFRRLLHPNGICLTGLWEITEKTTYSGYFARGSEALIVGRYSTCCTETRRGHSRSLSLVGKLFPTTDEEHKEPLPTANFITQQDFGGDYTDYINDAETRNAPDTSFWRRGSGIPILLLTGIVLMRADKEATIRQLHEIAELGKPADLPGRAPKFMRLVVDADQPRIEGEELDFRDEILAQIYDPGDPTPRRTLTFHIEVTDEGWVRGAQIVVRRTFKNWQRIGKITFDKAVASVNGDRVIHFHHALWRDKRDDPETTVRVNERRVD
ncbi:MAG: hypothetical protein QOE34_2060 [Verrucomicrobiota bacterium]|jgi:hypothetical protein